MRHVAGAAQHMTDGVACAHRNARLQSECREPGTQLAVDARFFVVRVLPGAQQSVTQIAQAGKTDALDQGISTTRTDRLDAVIHGARAGTEPQLFRCVSCDGGIEDERSWPQPLV